MEFTFAPAFPTQRSPCMNLREAFESALPNRWDAALTTRVFVGLFDLRDWEAWLVDAYALLDPQEWRRVQSRRVAADRDRLALAYALHRRLLGRALQCDAAEVPIGRDAAGCPRLSGEPLSTSLSHSDRAIAMAVTATGPVGVDIEPTSRASAMFEIAERVCHPGEVAGMQGLAGPARGEALLALWVRKEAFLKAAGVGLQREMHTFTASNHALLELPQGGTSWVRMLDAGNHWSAAISSAPELPAATAWLRPIRG